MYNIVFVVFLLFLSFFFFLLHIVANKETLCNASLSFVLHYCVAESFVV